MKTNTKLMLLLLCLGVLPRLSAQVTIGASESPAEGALLQLKNIPNASAGAANAIKGLLLPRVALVNDTELAPMFTGATAADKKEHAGLIVYNLTTNLSLDEGFVQWDGQKWSQVNYNKPLVVDRTVQKKLYTNPTAIDANSVKVDNLEITLGSDLHQGNPAYYAYPKFRKITADNMKYSYQMAQYWEDRYPTTPPYIPSYAGFSNDLSSSSFSLGTGYQGFYPNNDMSPLERNEIWLVSDNKQVYHIQFFVLGPSDIDKNEVYAILIERFE
ncbi:MAG: hypothetical protein LBS04_04990 [Tannerellaceae bacterium]|jgi:hypothetical protein|nr:hypothetical protein [Tannerellaceae bacterium]